MLTGEGDGRKRSAVSMNKEKPHCAFESYWQMKQTRGAAGPKDEGPSYLVDYHNVVVMAKIKENPTVCIGSS